MNDYATGNVDLEDEQWYAYYTNKANNKNYDDYPIYFELDNSLYVQTLKKYNKSKRFTYNGNS